MIVHKDGVVHGRSKVDCLLPNVVVLLRCSIGTAGLKGSKTLSSMGASRPADHGSFFATMKDGRAKYAVNRDESFS